MSRASKSTSSKSLASSALSELISRRTSTTTTADESKTLRRQQRKARQQQRHILQQVSKHDALPQQTNTLQVNEKIQKRVEAIRRRDGISAEEREVRKRILKMREYKRKGKAIVEDENRKDEDDDSDSD